MFPMVDESIDRTHCVFVAATRDSEATAPASTSTQFGGVVPREIEKQRQALAARASKAPEVRIYAV